MGPNVGWIYICDNGFLGLLFGKSWKNMEKMAVFLGGSIQIGKILHGRIQPDCGLYSERGSQR